MRNTIRITFLYIIINDCNIFAKMPVNQFGEEFNPSKFLIIALSFCLSIPFISLAFKIRKYLNKKKMRKKHDLNKVTKYTAKNFTLIIIGLLAASFISFKFWNPNSFFICWIAFLFILLLLKITESLQEIAFKKKNNANKLES